MKDCFSATLALLIGGIIGWIGLKIGGIGGLLFSGIAILLLISAGSSKN